ncbi:MAG: TolC family protein [Desulfocapsa sp.]|nr:TolC family protein [Desulfocapsa sp.]
MQQQVYHFSMVYFFFFFLLLPVVLQAAEPSTAEGVELSLAMAIEQALANNLSLKLQKEDAVAAEGGLLRTEGRFDTQLWADIAAGSAEIASLYSWSAEKEETAAFNTGLQKRFTSGTEVELGWENSRYGSDGEGTLIDPAYTSTLSMGIRQPLMRGWGKEIQTAERESAQKQLEIATYLVDNRAADLAALVKNAYWDLVFAWQDIEVRQFSLTLAEKLLEETRGRIEAGKLAPIEIYQPQSEVARREESLIGAERAIGAAEDELKVLLNSEDWLTPIKPGDLPRTEPVQLDLETVFRNAMANRPDIKAADLAVESAKIEVKVAEDYTRPSLNMVGRIGYGGTEEDYSDAVSRGLDDPETQWQVGLNLSLPFQNSYAKGALVQSMAAQRKAKTEAELLRLHVKQSVRTTVRDVHLAIKAMEATRKTSLAMEKRLEAEQAKFEAGSATTLDVLIAQDAYSQALSQENRISVVYVKGLAEVDRIQGLLTIKQR